MWTNVTWSSSLRVATGSRRAGAVQFGVDGADKLFVGGSLIGLVR